jgi:DNA-binding NtrC family response regulator
MSEEVGKRVLVLDDSPAIVKLVEAELLASPQVHYRYVIEGFSDPEQALGRVREQAFDAAISNYQMPGMTGLEFHQKVAAVQPDCVRLVLAGEADMDGLVRLINESHVYRFIPKPWPHLDLKILLAQAIDYFSVLAENRRLANLVRNQNLLEMPVYEGKMDQLLIVDDDLSILSSLARVLTRQSKVDDLFSVMCAEASHYKGPLLREGSVSLQVTSSPLQALQMAETTEFSCIISDYKMPEMDGVELLRRFAEFQPDCMRIFMSGQMSKEPLIQSMEASSIFAFISKPWTDFELKACIAQALAQRRMALENRKFAGLIRPISAAP